MGTLTLRAAYFAYGLVAAAHVAARAATDGRYAGGLAFAGGVCFAASALGFAALLTPGARRGTIKWIGEPDFVVSQSSAEQCCRALCHSSRIFPVDVFVCLCASCSSCSRLQVVRC